MRFILTVTKPVSLILTVIIVLTAVSHRYATAAMLSTESIVTTARGEEGRRYLYGILAREDVKAAFVAQGVDPQEARARVASLTDEEVIYLADKIDQLPAGGDAIGAIIGAALIVFFVLLITDLLGLTDVFPFVKKHR
ncbi:MAG: PA2779 family protein [Desulfobacterales bacterium]